MTKRSFSAAVAAALLIIGLLPGTASAAPIRLGNLDQDVAQQDAWVTVEPLHAVTQTFTAGATGRLVYVELYCSASSDNTLVAIGVGSFPMETWWCSTTPGWVAFPLFGDPPTVQSGAQYTIDIRVRGSSSVQLATSASDYAGGCFGQDGACAGDPTDIAFRTHVQPFPSVSLAWSPTTLPPGTPTPVTLTLQADFPGYVIPDGLRDTDRMAQITIDPLPAWFTWTGVTWCSVAPGPVDCRDLSPFDVGYGTNRWDLATAGLPSTITIAISGTATLPTGGGSASAGGCIGYIFPMYPYIDCISARADLATDGSTPPPPNGTPPPTATAPEGGSSGQQLPWLPWALGAGLASLLVIRRRAWAIR